MIKKEYRKIVYAAVIVIFLLMIETTALLLIKSSRLESQITELKYRNEALQEKYNVLRESEIEQVSVSEKTIQEVSADTLEETEETENKEGAVEVLSSIDAMEAGAVLDLAAIDMDNLENYFNASVISDEIFERVNEKSYRDNDVIGIANLRYLKVLHYNFNHEVQVGELIVNEQLAEDVINIFSELFEGEYEINSMYLVDNYWAGDGLSTDTASIDENNSSAFNYRAVAGGSNLSMHAYGCAIDINPQQNPYLTYNEEGELTAHHENAEEYIDRSSGKEHMIDHDDLCYQVFTKYGFTWGGDWDDVIDYQHFQKNVD